MERISSYDELAQLFRDSGLQHQADPANAAIQLPTSKDGLQGVLLVRWQAAHQVVDFLQTMPITIAEERLPAVALAMAMLNHALVLPGFGINPNTRGCYYRFTMPLGVDGALAKQEVQGLFNLAVRNASQHLAALRAVAEDGAEPASVLEQPT